MMEGAADDPRISDGEILLRRVHSGDYSYDENLHKNRLSSQAFLQDGPDGPTSVYLNSETTPEVVMSEGSEEYLVSVSVGAIREQELGVVRDGSTGGLGHCVITGRKTRGKLRKIIEATAWVDGYRPD